MTVHNLKIRPEYFAPVVSGYKTFEIRVNDRDYAVGDLLMLREWENGTYTGGCIDRTVTYVFDLNGYLGQDFDESGRAYVVLGISEPRDRVRHLVRGTSYDVYGMGSVQSDRIISEGHDLVIYRGDDGKFWLRPPEEFDQRFIDEENT